MHKAARNRALSAAEKAANRLISSVRAKVERAFGTLKRGYGFFRTRYLGIPKVELEFLRNRQKNPFLRLLNFLAWSVPRRGDHGSIGTGA
ncbi:transposase [Desulfovibrio aerotolerans]|uniref:Transposase n=1 Tax=Solidesulfovibrio aerotolerans TaxID=295255 RepID=A0A7C9IP63_9BACT|nr:transposase [Solidesulfovibrio aerotolerans]MYL85404.1 transposase [Solidesulfovibrio aerotolerans]